MSKISTSPELLPDHSNLKLLSKSTPLKTSVFQQNGPTTLDIPSPPVPSKSSITTNKAANLSHVPCKFFKQGACTAGTNCTFSHNPTPTSEASVCKYFIKGNCKFGAKCALLHTMSPYGDGRKFLSNRFNGGGSSLFQQQQQQQQSPSRYHSNGFSSQLTAAIQQQHDQRYQQQQQTSRTLATSTPISIPLAHYLQHNPISSPSTFSSASSLKHHHGITGLRTSSIWDTPTITTSQSYDQRHDSILENGGGFTNNHGFFGINNGGSGGGDSGVGGGLQQIPEMFGLARVSQQSSDLMMDPDSVFPSSTAPGHHYSHSHDTRTRFSSRFFQNSDVGNGDYAQKLLPSSHSQSSTFQGQPYSSSSSSSFDRFGAPIGNTSEINDNIWNNTSYRFSSSLSSGYPDLSAHAINIPSHGERYHHHQQQQQTTATIADDVVDVTCHFIRYPRLPQHSQQQQQQQKETSIYTSTPEPSLIIPSIIGSSSYQQQQQQPQSSSSCRLTTTSETTLQAPGTRHKLQQLEDSDIPFMMDDTDDISPLQQHQQQQQQHEVAMNGYASFTSLVRPTY